MIFFDNKINIKILDKKDIFEILSVYMLIRTYIESINKKIIDTFYEEVKQEKSMFDEYDAENGYTDNLEIENIYDSYLELFNDILDFAISKKINSLKECLDTNILDLVNFIKFKLNKDEDLKDYD